MSKVLLAALEYASKGYPVFPISPNSKVPISGIVDKKGVGGHAAATTNRATINGWFTKYPDANVAIATRGLLVVDVDPVKGERNPYLESEEIRSIRQAPCSRTPRGGYHFFLMPEQGEVYHNTAGHLAEKVDTRADGGYVLMAPSTTVDGAYTWPQPLPDRGKLPEIPELIRRGLAKASKTKPEDMGVHQTMLETAKQGVRSNKGIVEILNACLKLHKDGHRSDEPSEKIDREIGRIIKHAFQQEAAHGALQDRLDFYDGTDADDDKAPSVATFTTRLERAEGERKKQLVGDIIQDPSFGVISAPPNIGKTAIAVGLTRCIADGVPLFQNPKLAPTRTGPVVVVELENDIDWADREVAFDMHHKQDHKHEVLVCNNLNLNDNNSIRAFTRGLKMQVAQYGVPVLLLVDTYGMVIAGTNENSASDISPIINFFKRFKSKGTTVVLLHHPTKSGSSAVRGAALRGAVDFVLTVEDKGSTGDKDFLEYHRELATDKQRAGRNDSAYPFKMVVVRGKDNAGQEWDAVVVDTWEPEVPVEMFDPLTLQVLQETGLGCTTIEGMGRKTNIREMWKDHCRINDLTVASAGSRVEYMALQRKVILGLYNTMTVSGHWQLVEEKDDTKNKRYPWLGYIWQQVKPLILEDEGAEENE